MADDEVVVHVGSSVRRYRNLIPATSYRLDGVEARTLRRPGGELLSVIATVNDVHFGETECGMIDGLEIGPVLRSEPGESPYPETMNRGAIAEITRLGPDAVVAKGDLTSTGTMKEYDDFVHHYQEAFGDRLYQVRGNHDAETGQTFAAESVQEVVIDGVTLAILDTVIPGASSGQVTANQLAWLDEVGARADRPVLVFGHHHPWDPASTARPPDYFGINPTDSEGLVEVLTRRPRLVGYFAGHTHRNRVRHFAGLPTVPIVEVASVKDFPGSWAEYRVFDGGILQIHRRVSTPEALDWTDRTRAMFFGNYAGYSFGAISDRCFALDDPAPTR